MKEFFTASEHKPSNVSFAESLLNFDIPEILKGDCDYDCDDVVVMMLR